MVEEIRELAIAELENVAGLRELKVDELENVAGGCNCCDCVDICMGAFHQLLWFFRRNGI